MHPFPILERWVSDDLVVEGKASASFSTFTSSTTSNTATTFTSPPQKSSGKCPFSMMSKKDNTEKNTVKNTNTARTDENQGSEIDERNERENTPQNPHITPSPTPSQPPSHVAVRGHTQVVMFPSDWRSDSNWPVFGAGKRACPGDLHKKNLFLSSFFLSCSFCYFFVFIY
jgi:hypothetical protein